MIKIGMDKEIDAVYIEFESGKAGYAEELDDNRIVDFSANPGKPIGVSLHSVSKGVKLDGLPNPEQVSKILNGLDIATYK